MSLKKIGKTFFRIKQKDPGQIRQAVLLVEGGFILPNNFVLIVRNVKEKFQNARITVLTFEERVTLLREYFPEIEFITPRSKNKRFGLYMELWKTISRKFDFIVLSALDIVPLILSLGCAKARVLLHNRWFEWYQVRQRTAGDVLRGVRSTDSQRRNKNYSLKDILKSIGRLFVLVRHLNDDTEIATDILMLDNGYTPVDHLLAAIRSCEETFIKPKITLITFQARQQCIIDHFPKVRLYTAGEKANSAALVGQLFGLRNQRFNTILLTTLDMMPIVFAKGFTTANVLLYNQWHQWWGIELKDMKEYLVDVFRFLILIPVMAYLLVASGIILLRTFIRLRFLTMRHLWKLT